MNCAAIILAAGESRRLGQPKQLALFRGKPLLQQAIDTAQQGGCSPIIVILGAAAEDIRSRVNSAVFIENPDWQLGMGTSIRAGVAALPETTTATLLMLCDQPLVTAEEIKKLIEASSITGLAASEYSGTTGVPAVFGRPYFSDLRSVHPARGAKEILKTREADVVRIRCPNAAVDIDTAADLDALIKCAG